MKLEGAKSLARWGLGRFIRIRIEPRPSPSVGVILLASVAALLLAFAVTSVIFWAYGVSPLRAWGVILKGSLGSAFALSETVRRALPLLLVGAGLALSFKFLFWNIGAEGQLLMGAVAATWVALFSGLPGPLLIPIMLLLGFLAGALWGLIAAVLRATLRVNEVITTLMMNYIAMDIVLYLIHGPWKGEQKWGFAYTDTFPHQAWLGTIGQTRIPWVTLVIGLVAAISLYFLLMRTKYGFEIRVIGANPQAGRFAGMSYTRAASLVMLISGGLAGLAGVGEVAGVHHLLRHPQQISLGYGYLAIIVAWLARANPLAVPLTAFLFGAIFAGGDVMRVALGLPFQMVSIWGGLILLFLIASELLVGYEVSFSFGFGSGSGSRSRSGLGRPRPRAEAEAEAGTEAKVEMEMKTKVETEVEPCGPSLPGHLQEGLEPGRNTGTDPASWSYGSR